MLLNVIVIGVVRIEVIAPVQIHLRVADDVINGLSERSSVNPTNNKMNGVDSTFCVLSLVFALVYTKLPAIPGPRSAVELAVEFHHLVWWGVAIAIKELKDSVLKVQ